MLITEIKQQTKPRNMVIKNSINKAGAGAHEEKDGKRAKRSRQKAKWKREVQKHKKLLDI